MSRSRNIKPGFFLNEVLVTMPYEYRLLFIGLWTLADREGRFEDRPMRIKMALFPADPVDVKAGIDCLVEGGFIDRYIIDSVAYCQILAWSKHQNPHPREAASAIPCKDEAKPRRVQGKSKALPSNAGSSDSLHSDSLQELRDPEPADEEENLNGVRVPVKKIVALYESKLPMCPRIEKLTDARKGYIRQRWIEDLPTLEAWENYFEDVSKSRFLSGLAPGRDGKPPFVADLEWLCRPSNFAKVAEGKYHR